jgi:ParB family chromosome partitioning protein
MSTKAKSLGGGVSFGNTQPVSARRAAINAATKAPTEGVPTPNELPLQVISQNPDNPRDHLRDLSDLTDSIRELGVINSITVANVSAYLLDRSDRTDDLDPGTTHVVIDGHRRLEAARRAGLTTIKVQVDDARVSTDEALLETAFVANYHRDDMTDLEQANALNALVEFYGSQTKASQRLGIPQGTLSSKLSLLKLTPELQADLAQGNRKVEHVRNLGKLTPDQQRAKADERAESAARTAVNSAPRATDSETPAEYKETSERRSPKDGADARRAERVAKPPGQRDQPAPRFAAQSNEPSVTPDLDDPDPAVVAQWLRERMSTETRKVLVSLLLEDLPADA